MSINHVLLTFSHDVPVSRLDNTLEIGSREGSDDMGVKKIQVRFNNNYQIEIKQNKRGKVVITMTQGGVSKIIDLQTFRQLISMNY